MVMFENINMFNVYNNVWENAQKMSKDAQDHQLGEDPNGDVWSVRQCLSCSIKTSVSLTSTSASTQSLVHNQWRGDSLSTIVAEVDDDDYTQSLLHNQWNGGLNEHRSGSLPNKWENKQEHKKYKIQKNWSQSMGILGNGCVCNIEQHSTNIWKAFQASPLSLNTLKLFQLWVGWLLILT